MKKPTKSIITSSLLAVAFGALSVGSTFALFTSQSKTEISVGSGIVNVESKATLVSYQSTVEGETIYPITDNTYENPLIGNRFALDGNTVTIDKMVPGDVLTLKLSALNKSNVKTKTRFMVSHATVGTKGDLFPALDFTFKAGTLNATDLFRWQDNVAVEEANMAAGVALYGDDGILVTIAFPDGDNGEILFGSENHDNQYQDAACSIAFSLQAVQGNAATSPIDEINTYLSAEMLFEGQNKTMHDAVVDMAEIEYTDLDVLDGYVYDLANDQFVKETSVNANKVNYFKVYESMPTTQEFSIYAVGNGWTTVEGLTVGFDAGDTSGITSITYDRHLAEEGQEVTIRTNTVQTTLTINAPLDTIHHYDALGALNIIEAATSSYHEHGKIAFAEIKAGRIVLEPSSDVKHIHINSNGNNAYNTIIIKDNGAENLPSAVTRETVTLSDGDEKLVVKVISSEGNEDDVYVYFNDIHRSTTYQDGTHNTDVDTVLGEMVLDDAYYKQGTSATEKEAAKTALIEVALTHEEHPELDEYDIPYDAVAWVPGTSTYYTDIKEACASEENIQLLKDITNTQVFTYTTKSIDFNHYKLTTNGNGLELGENSSYVKSKNVTITVENGSFAGKYNYNSLVQMYPYNSYTFKDCTFTNGTVKLNINNKNYTSGDMVSMVKFENCIFTNTKVQFAGLDGANNQIDVEFKDCTFTGDSTELQNGISHVSFNYYVYGNAKFDKCSFSGTSTGNSSHAIYFGNMYSSLNATFNNVTIDWNATGNKSYPYSVYKKNLFNLTETGTNVYTLNGATWSAE